MKALAHQIEHELERGEWKHCAIYEGELQRFWPLQQKEREAEIASFAMEYGFRLLYYRKGLCAIFGK